MLISVDSRTFLLSKINKLRRENNFFKNSSLKNLVILSENFGPQKFLSDLILTIEQNNLAEVTCNFLNSNIHIINSGFYSPIWKYMRPKNKDKVLLRLDGIGIDTPNIQESKIKFHLCNLIDKSSFLIYQSNFCKNCFLDLFESLPEGNIIINGANEISVFQTYGDKLLKQIREKYEDKFFTLAGRFTSRKRIKEVIEQFNESDLGNLVVFSDVPEEFKYKNPRIMYLGMVAPETARYLISKSIALIHFDRYDWCPNLVIGAIYDRIPVICSNFGGTPEITGKNGLIIKEFPEDLPQNLDGIEFVKNANFPSELFKEIIYEIQIKGINISINKVYDINDTAKEYVNTASNCETFKKDII